MRADIAWEHEVARLRDLRKAQGLTQMGLAELLECSQAGLHEWETGKRQPRITTWLRWREALGLQAPWDTSNTDQQQCWRKSMST